MNHVFLEERCREKAQDLLTEGMASQEFYRNRTINLNHFHRLVRGIVTRMKVVIPPMFSKKKHPVLSHNPSRH